MNISVREAQTWNRDFFADFVSFGNRIYQNIPEGKYRLKDTLSDFENLFGTSAAFDNNNHWKAYLAVDEDGEILCRLIVADAKKSALSFCPCGWFETVNQNVAAGILFERAQAWAKTRGKSLLRGPIQGNFFLSYRIQIPRSLKNPSFAPVYGEPIYPGYYHEIFTACGFRKEGHWQSVKVSFQSGQKNCQEIVERFQNNHLAHEIKARSVDLSDWKAELQRIHQLFIKSYAQMADYMPISFEEFEASYRDFHQLIHQDLVFFLETKGEAFAFVVAYFDPLPALKSYERLNRWLPNSLAKLVTFLKLRCPWGRRLLITYIGKVDVPGFNSKGVAGLLGAQLGLSALRYRKNEVYLNYLADDSPTFASLPRDFCKVADYVLYERAVYDL